MQQTLRIVVPTGAAPAAQEQAGNASANRRETVWLLHNGKAHGDVILRTAGRILERAGWTTTSVSKELPSSPCPDDLAAVGLTHAGAITALSD
ncbi:MAG: hypothetical protein R8G01_06600 [Ilumatobacteraceae bacterium]|nr:hypothetical protein [Ilumatobacteraceae bacterium]